MGVIQSVEFQTIEHQRRRERRDLVLAIRHELGPFAIRRDLIIAQAGVRHDATCNNVDLFITLDGSQKPSCVQFSQFPFVCSSEFSAFLFQPSQIARQLIAVRCRIKVAQVPFWQFSKVLAALGICIKNRLGKLHQNTFHRSINPT